MLLQNKSIIDNRILIFGFFFLLLFFYSCQQESFYQQRITSFPSLNINYEGGIPIDDKIDIVLEDHENHLIEGNIKRRGGFSIVHPKHSFEIDLNIDFPLLNLPADDDWILISSYIDKTFLRHVISYDLFSEMGSYNKVSQNKWVELELNQQYHGLYILMEKLDKSSLEINENDTDAFIFKEPHLFRQSYDGVVPQYPNNFHQQTYPKIEEEDKTQVLEDIRSFILNSNQEEFSQGISLIFDLRNIIDWHLLLLLTNNSDGILKNFVLYKTDQNPIRIAPWDYDHSFGRDGDNELNLDVNHLDVTRSILFERLLQLSWYRDWLKNRWEELNHSGNQIFSLHQLQSRIIRKSQQIYKVVEKNFEVWPTDGPFYYDNNNFNQEVEIILEFLQLRHHRLSNYFDSLE